MPVALFDEPAPDFSDPLGLLAACHQRMLGFCDLLERLQPWVESHGIDDDATEAARRVMHYFDTAGELHHRDEEADLFPLLASEESLRPLIERLQREHQTLDQHWQVLARQLRALLQGQTDLTALRAAIDSFCSVHREHIRMENQQLLPAAGSLLSAAQLRALGRTMSARRHAAAGAGGK
ncbi:MAG: hemerythrin domain-containing protein [Chromatiaceae bacterium]|nr:hemerythrin domain-containing protein [Chromatiaceae bacterium]